MKKLKLIFACLLTAILSIGQMWAVDPTISWDFKTLQTTSGTQSGITWETGKTGSATATACNGTNGLVLYGVASGGGYFQTTSAISGTITNVNIVSTAKKNTPKYTVYCSTDGSTWDEIAAAQTAGTKDHAVTGSYTYVKVANTTAATAQLGVASITVTYTPSGGGSTPSLSVDPTVIDFGTVDQNAVVASKTVAVTFANLTGSVTYSGLSGAFSASGSISATGDEITIAANTATIGNYSQTLTVQSAADSKSQDVTVKMNVVEPFDGLKLTFDVSSNPGEWPTTNSTTTTNYTYTLNEVDYTFALNNVKCNSGYLMLTSVAKLGLPAISGYKLVKVEATNSSGCSTTTQVSVSSSDATKTDVTGGTAQTWGTTSTKYTYNLSGTEENTMYYLWIANKNCQLVELTLYYEEAEAATVATPVISGTESFLTSTEVSIACTTDGATVYYTTDGTDPKTSESKQTYSAAFTLTNTATVRAIATKDAEWSSEATSKTFTKITPINVAAALSATSGDAVYVQGTITSITEVNIGYKNATYVISDISAGIPQNEMIVYRGKYIGGADFTSADQIHVGDVVVVSGSIAVHAEKNQMAQGNQIETISAPAVAAPVFEPNGGGFMGETDVTISCATASSSIYYTLDGTTPSKSSTLYEGAIHLTATTTINAIAYVGDDASLVISKTFTLTAPMTVAEALTALDSENPINNVAVAGIISIAPSSNPSSGRLTYYISDDGSDTNELEVYLGFGLNGASFSAKTDLQVGDEVTVFGNLKIHSGSSGDVKEFDAGSRLLAFNRPEVAVESVSLPAAETVEVGSTVTLTATVLPANATNKSITWTVESGNAYASVVDGVVTGLVAGPAVIRATSVADGTKYAECTVTVVAADPTKHVVTFDATVDKGESPLSKSNITFSCTNGVLNNESEYRLYKSSTTTFACPVGNITKIEFTGVSGNPVSGFGDPEVGTLVTEGNNGVWTGNAESVSFVASDAQVRATEIVVTYKEDNRAAAGLVWSTDAVELTVGDEFTAPSLTNPHSLTVSIASDNTDLATVSAGVVSLVADATGTATITATFAGNEDYKPAVVSYTITVSEAGLDNVTFDATLDVAETGELSISKSGFTLEFTGGALDNGENYRLYKSQTMTLSSSSYLIKKIEFTCTSGNPISGFADAEGLDKANNQWTGEANSVELTASNAQVRIEKLKVYYIEDTRAASGLAWSTDEVEITLGDAFTPANLVNPNSIDASAITIESDNTDLAVVNDGVVSLVADATGTAHIKAIFAGNATYKPAKISYTIIVNDPTPTIYVDKLNVNFGSVEVGDAVPAAQTITVSLSNVAAVTATLGGTNPEAFSISKTEGIVDDDVITISVLASTAAEASYSATIAISDGAEGAVDKTVNLSFAVTAPASDDDVSGTWTLVTSATTIAAGKKVIIAQHVDADGAINTMAGQATNNRSVIASTVAGTTLTPAIGTKVMTLANAAEGKFYLMTSDDEYLYNASTSSKSYLKTKAEAENASWTISADADGVATITSVENTNRINMRYNENGSNPALFNCYATGQSDIALYMLEDETPEPELVYTEVRSGLDKNRFYTVCLEKAITHVKGATFWSLANRNEAGTLAYLEEEVASELEPLPAGKPFIIRATAAKLEVVYEGATGSAGTNGALVGTFDDLDAAALNTINETGENDVYMLFNNELRPIGANNHLDAHRAYVLFNLLNPVSSEPKPAPGRRVLAMPMQKDVTTDIDALNASETPVKMMIDGQLFILRGEKLYDATGRLVK